MNKSKQELLDTIKARQEKIEREQEAIREELKQLDNEKDKETYVDVVRELFKDYHFFIDYDGIIMQSKDNDDFTITNLNNALKKEQLESILALNKLANVAKYLNGDWVPDWDLSTDKFCFYYDHNENEIDINHSFGIQRSTPYFKSNELAQRAIEILGEEEIKKALTLNH